MDDMELEHEPHISWWDIVTGNAQSRYWQVQQWIAMRLCGLHFCHSCSGYFYEVCMALPDKCETCYARDYGLPFTYDPATDRGR